MIDTRLLSISSGVAYYRINKQNTHRTNPHIHFKILDIPLPKTNLAVRFSYGEKTINKNLVTLKNSLKLIDT